MSECHGSVKECERVCVCVVLKLERLHNRSFFSGCTERGVRSLMQLHVNKPVRLLIWLSNRQVEEIRREAGRPPLSSAGTEWLWSLSGTLTLITWGVKCWWSASISCSESSYLLRKTQIFSTKKKTKRIYLYMLATVQQSWELCIDGLLHKWSHFTGNDDEMRGTGINGMSSLFMVWLLSLQELYLDSASAFIFLYLLFVFLISQFFYSYFCVFVFLVWLCLGFYSFYLCVSVIGINFFGINKTFLNGESSGRSHEKRTSAGRRSTRRSDEAAQCNSKFCSYKDLGQVFIWLIYLKHKRTFPTQVQTASSFWRVSVAVSDPGARLPAAVWDVWPGRL